MNILIKPDDDCLFLITEAMPRVLEYKEFYLDGPGGYINRVDFIKPSITREYYFTIWHNSTTITVRIYLKKEPIKHLKTKL